MAPRPVCQSNAAATFPGGLDGRAGSGTGSRCNADTSLERVLFGLPIFSPPPFSFQDVNCKLSNYLMKIHPGLAKCGQRFGMSVPREPNPHLQGLFLSLYEL